MRHIREQALATWIDYLKRAENSNYEDSKRRTKKVYRVTVAEVLGVGDLHFMPPALAVVRDTSGHVWLIPETLGNLEGSKGLVSRHNIEPGMVIDLVVESLIVFESKAFVVSPPER